MKVTTTSLGLGLLGALLFGCQSQPEATQDSVREDFAYAQNLAHKNRNMRKWDAPAFADLDQDGWVDVILNNHGYGIQIVWNNQGTLAEPWDLLMGDIHGVTIGDIDADGLLEMLLSRGGGSGSNARTARVFKAHQDRQFTEMREQDESLAAMRGRTLVLFDGDADGDLDLMNFAFPDNKAEASENYLYENKPGVGFSGNRTLARSYSDGQKTYITDIDNDGVVDILMYGHKQLRAFKGEGAMKFKAASDVFEQPIHHVTGIAQIDYDGDGDWDIYLSRGQDFESGQTFCSQDQSVWAGYGKRGRFDFGLVPSGEVLPIKNYQSPWPNKRLMIGESAYQYEFEGETYSGADITLLSSDSLGWPDEFTEKGLYAGYVGNEQWHLAGASWSPLTVAVAGLSQCKAPAYAAGPEDILLENIGGRYRRAPHQIFDGGPSHNVATLAADVDNDGWQDLVVMPRGNLTDPLRPQMLMNQAGKGFRQVDPDGVSMNEPGAVGMALGAVDVNLDGQLDLVIGNERGKWSLYQNQMQKAAQNQYVILDFGAEGSGRATWLDAEVKLTACGRTQMARAGDTSAAYSRNYNRYMHFGIGDCNRVEKASIRLTNGDATVLTDLGVNSIHKVTF
ncbi:CRTAC1 family protein [Gilvimarinus chinensis]|uniref:CRTAC1 family protein n=1 Tax=Gilvimarinus chinensis TaxID=396005 RepID=UPI0003A0AD12|nr:CRTAC1 family protein [Gilvimarinus chinensis]